MKDRPKFVIVGLLTGLLSGLLGIGGGILFVPILTTYFGMTQHMAQATSILTIIPTASFSSVIYWLHGSLDLKLFLNIAIGSMIGAAIGARLMKIMPENRLRKLFAVYMMLIGLRMVIG